MTKWSLANITSPAPSEGVKITPTIIELGEFNSLDVLEEALVKNWEDRHIVPVYLSSLIINDICGLDWGINGKGTGEPPILIKGVTDMYEVRVCTTNKHPWMSPEERVEINNWLTQLKKKYNGEQNERL